MLRKNIRIKFHKKQKAYWHSILYKFRIFFYIHIYICFIAFYFHLISFSVFLYLYKYTSHTLYSKSHILKLLVIFQMPNKKKIQQTLPDLSTCESLKHTLSLSVIQHICTFNTYTKHQTPITHIHINT